MPVLEHDGTLYACDHFLDPAHRVGTIQERPLAELLDDPRLRAFGQAKRDSLPPSCVSCDVLAACNGGCPKDQCGQTPGGAGGVNYLCPAFTRFFRHVQSYAATLNGGGPPIPADHAEAQGPVDAPARLPLQRSVGRNDPCPCGSGRKFKRRCLRAW